MPAEFWPSRTPHTVTRGVRNGTTFIRLTPTGWNPGLRPVIHLHGWPQDGTAAAFGTSDTSDSAAAFRLLLATGRVIYAPFTGSNFGHATDSYPETGGTGLQAVDDMVDQATADGLPTGTIDLWGVSMGGTNALNWAARNMARTHRVYLSMPGLDFGSLWDFGSTLRTTLEEIYDASGRADLLTKAADRDPVQMSFAAVRARLAANLASNDSLINYASASAWMAQWSVPHTVTTGNHFAYTAPWSELQPYRWLLGHDLMETP